MKKALVTGITGQDGAYLAQFLLDRGYKVYGTYRRSSSSNFWRIEELNISKHPNLELVEYDLTDMSQAFRVVNKIRPKEIYNLAAQSFVGASFEQPITTTEITAVGVLNLLEAIRVIDRDIKFYQASTSEMFGKVQETPQRETTPFYPRSPYGVSKLYAHWMTLNYRESYNIFGVSGILFNHESPLRGLEFVTRKITDSVAKIKLGKADTLELGNLDAKRDWGFAKEYVEGMYLMLQAKEPDNFILATNRSYTIREFAKLSFKAVGIDIDFQGEGLNEVGVDRASGRTLIRVNSKFFRPAEVDILMGDYSKAKAQLGWEPKTSLWKSLLRMIDRLGDLEEEIEIGFKIRRIRVLTLWEQMGFTGSATLRPIFKERGFFNIDSLLFRDQEAVI